MKWIGQHIVDLIARFRGDVYLEDVDTGTIASGGNLGLDSNNKIVKATEATGDITSVTLGTDGMGLTVASGDVNWTIAGGAGVSTAASGGDTITIGANSASTTALGVVELATTAETTTGTDTIRVVTPDGLKDGYQGSTNVTTLGTIAEGTWQGTAVASAYLDSDTAHLSVDQTFTGVKTFGKPIIIGEDRTMASGDGAAIHVDAFDMTDGTTSTHGTAALYSHVAIEPPRLLATNASVTTTNASTLYVKGPPVASTNQTITNAYAVYVDDGDVFIEDDLYLEGTLKFDSASLSTVQTSSESFADNNTSLMTSAAIDDKINTKYSTSYITFSAKSTSSYGTNYVMIHASGISESTFSVDSSVDSAGDFGGVTTEEGGSGTDATATVASGNLEQQIPIPETCKLIGFYATTTTSTDPGAGYDTGVAIWHVPESGVNWGSSTASTATLIHKSDSSRHTEGSNRKKVQKVERMDGTAKTLGAGDILIPSIFGETSNQQIMATITLVIATPIKTIV